MEGRTDERGKRSEKEQMWKVINKERKRKVRINEDIGIEK